MTQLADTQQAVVDASAKVEGVTAAEMYADDAPAQAEETNVSDPVEGQEENAQIEAIEPEQPAIDAPASWAADAKEVFEGLPPEAQQIIADREREREQFVNAKAREVATVRQQAEQHIAAQVAEQTRGYAQQLQQFAAMFEVAPPDPRLLSTGNEQDRAYFYQQDAAYRNATAQRDQLQQQATEAQRQADAAEQQALHAEMRQEAQALVELFPEASDPAGYAKLVSELEPYGKMLGYTPEILSQARAVDFKALSIFREKCLKADKFDALNKAKMVPVRDAKRQPRPFAPGTSGGQPAPQDIAAQLYPDDVRK